MEFWLILSGAILLVCVILLAILLTPKKNKKPLAKQVKKPAAPPVQETKPANPQTQKAKTLIELEKNKRKRKEVVKFADNYPAITARFVRKWLWEGKRRK